MRKTAFEAASGRPHRGQNGDVIAAMDKHNILSIIRNPLD
jgi:hypothetical protein